MTKKEIDIIISNDDVWDMLMYIYCLKRAPDQFSNVPNVPSEIQQAERNMISALQQRKNHFE